MIKANHQRIVLLLIVLLAVAVRVGGMGTRLPFIYHSDEPMYIDTVQNMVRNGDLNPYFFRYPTLFFYLNALAYVPYVIVARLTGSLTSASEISEISTIVMGSTYAPQPGLILLQRSVTVLFSAGLVLLIYAVALKLTGKHRAATLAALITALSSHHVNNGRLITPDTYVTFFAMATVYAALLIYEKGRTRDYILGGIMVGLTAGSKYNGVLVAITILVAHLLRHGWKGLRDWRIYAAGAISALAFFISTPYAIIDWRFFLEEIGIVGTHYATGHAGMEGDTIRWYLGFLWKYITVLFPLAIIAMGKALAQRDKPALIVAAFPVAYFVFIARFTIRNGRTMLPAMGMLFVLAVWLLDWLWTKAQTIEKATLRSVVYIGLLLMVALSLAIPGWYTGKSLISQYTITGRETAYAWLAENLPEGSTVAIEAYVPYIDPQKHNLLSFQNMIFHDAGWYQDAGVDFLVFGQGMFGRYFNNPQRYATQVAQYQALFDAFEHVRTFDEGGYVVHVYRNPN